MNIGLEVLKQNKFEIYQEYPVEPEYIDRMFDYYNNMITIKESIQKYCYSTEGILESIGNAIKAFFAWLREMFRRFITFIGYLLISIPMEFDKILHLFKLSKQVTINFDDKKLCSVAKQYATLVNMKMIFLSHDPIEELKKFLNIFKNEIDNEVLNQQPKIMEHSDLFDILSALSHINAASRSKVQNMTDVLKEVESDLAKYEKDMSSVKSEEESYRKTIQFDQYITKKLNTLGFNEKHFPVSSSTTTQREIVSLIRYKIQLLNQYISTIVQCGKRLSSIISDLLRACGKSARKVCIAAPIPDFLLKHLKEHFQYPGFKLSTVFLTNDIISVNGALGGMSDDGPPDLDVSDYLAGLTHPNSDELVNKAEQSVTCVHVTHGAIKNIIHRLSTGSFKQSTAFLTILVHEARHAYQMQTNKKFDGYADGYETSAEEKDANKHMYRFVPTEQEQSWAKRVLSDYEKEVKLAEQNAAKLQS